MTSPRSGASGGPATPAEQKAMLRAVELAQRGTHGVEPNPRVGAVALRNGEVVGEGWHAECGGPHAEVVALADAATRDAAPADALVVTLEPCSTPAGIAGKRTPPCTDALLAAGVRRVVVGVKDPDSRHAGRGLDLLRAAGIDVTVGAAEQACAELLRPFAEHLKRDRPWTIAKWAMTLDGKTACAGGDARWISGPESRRVVHQIRARVDAVVVGYRTALLDDPQLTVRDVPGDSPLRVVIDPAAALPHHLHLVNAAHEHPTCWIVRDDAEISRLDALQKCGVQIVQVPQGETSTAHAHSLSLCDAFAALHARGVRALLLEGGGALAGDAFDADLVDQVFAFIAPKVVGGAAAPTPASGVGIPAMADARRLTEVRWEASGDDLVCRGLVDRRG